MRREFSRCHGSCRNFSAWSPTPMNCHPEHSEGSPRRKTIDKEDPSEYLGMTSRERPATASRDKPIAFTPGSAMSHARDFFQASADACAKLKRRGILLTRHLENIPDSLPEGVIHVSYAPFSELLPHCAAIVHHGGIGTTAQALQSATPQLIMPMSHDQPRQRRPTEKARRGGLDHGEELSPRRRGGKAARLDRFAGSRASMA